jgi:hypothetical protein
MSYPSENLVLSERLTEIQRGKRGKIENLTKGRIRKRERKRGAAINNGNCAFNPDSSDETAPVDPMSLQSPDPAPSTAAEQRQQSTAAFPPHLEIKRQRQRQQQIEVPDGWHPARTVDAVYVQRGGAMDLVVSLNEYPGVRPRLTISPNGPRRAMVEAALDLDMSNTPLEKMKDLPCMVASSASPRATPNIRFGRSTQEGPYEHPSA